MITTKDYNEMNEFYSIVNDNIVRIWPALITSYPESNDNPHRVLLFKMRHKRLPIFFQESDVYKTYRAAHQAIKDKRKTAYIESTLKSTFESKESNALLKRLLYTLVNSAELSKMTTGSYQVDPETYYLAKQLIKKVEATNQDFI